jgi:hypothetical protein
MTVAVYVTKIEMVDPKTATVSVVIDSDPGRLQLNLLAAPSNSQPNVILDQVRSQLARFGNELLNQSQSLRFSIPPQLK